MDSIHHDKRGFSLDVYSLAEDPATFVAPRCPQCNEVLDLHQPVEETPDRLLGTCAGCDSWYLLAMGWGGRDRLAIIRLPGEEDLQTDGKAAAGPPSA